MECNCGTTTNLLMAADFADPVWCAVCKVNLDLDEMPVSDALKRELEDWTKEFGKWIDWDSDLLKSEAVKVRQAVYGTMQNKSNKIGVIKLKPNQLLVLPGGGMEKGEAIVLGKRNDGGNGLFN